MRPGRFGKLVLSDKKIDMVLGTPHISYPMSAKRIRICGWIDKKLKADFLRHCQVKSHGKGRPLKMSQSRLLEMILAAESVLNTRKRVHLKG